MRLTKAEKKLQEKFLQATLDRLQDNPPGTPGERRVLRKQLWLAFEAGRSWHWAIQGIRGATCKPVEVCVNAYVTANGDVKKAIKLLGGRIP